MGGQDFYIQFDDGDLIHTRNLWLNGDIPAEFRDQLPDNAKFLSAEQYREARRELEVALEIEQLKATIFEVRYGKAAVNVSWNELSFGAQDEMLGKAVDWTGIAQEEKSAIITKALGLDQMEREARQLHERLEAANAQIERVKSMNFTVEEGKAPEPCFDPRPAVVGKSEPGSAEGHADGARRLGGY